MQQCFQPQAPSWIAREKNSAAPVTAVLLNDRAVTNRGGPDNKVPPGTIEIHQSTDLP